MYKCNLIVGLFRLSLSPFVCVYSMLLTRLRLTRQIFSSFHRLQSENENGLTGISFQFFSFTHKKIVKNERKHTNTIDESQITLYT